MSAKYWCARSIVVTVEGPDGRFSATIDKPFARIGSHDSSEVVLSHKDVAQRCVYLHATDAGVLCIRLAASGSEREEVRDGWLAPDQIVEIGPYRITVQLADWPVEAEVPQPDLEAPDSEPPHPQLAIVHRGRTVAHYPLRRRLTVVGRGGRSTLQLADARVSATHCVLYREADKLWAIDLLSSNGTLLAGRPLQAARVEPGESLALGNVELVYTRPRSITRPTAAGKFATLRSWATRAIATTGTKCPLR